MVEVILQARNQTIGDLVQQCVEGKLPFPELCQQVARMGYKTTSLYEMVMTGRSELKP